jgi:hypothetical protein
MIVFYYFAGWISGAGSRAPGLALTGRDGEPIKIDANFRELWASHLSVKAGSWVALCSMRTDPEPDRSSVRYAHVIGRNDCVVRSTISCSAGLWPDSTPRSTNLPAHPAKCTPTLRGPGGQALQNPPVFRTTPFAKAVAGAPTKIFDFRGTRRKAALPLTRQVHGEGYGPSQERHCPFL